jgi:hypothetical protein
LLGVVVVGRDLANAQVLLQFQNDLRKVVQPAQDFLADRGAVVKVAGNQPIHILGPALFESHAQPGVPHLTGVHTPRIENIRVSGDDVFAEIKEMFVTFHGVMGLAIHHRDRARVFVFLPVEAGDQLVELFQVRVIARLPKGINYDGMNFAVLISPGFFPGCLCLGLSCARPCLFHGLVRVSSVATPYFFKRKNCC